MHQRQRIAVQAAALCLTLGVGVGGVARGDEAHLRREVLSMGTRLGVDVDGPSAERLAAATERALAEARRIEAACSTWHADSAWSHLNAAGGGPVVLGAEWVELLSTALAWSRATEGAFDPVLGRLIDAWGLRGDGHTPSPEALAAAREASGARWLALDRPRGVARLAHPRAAVEEGGFLKGYALDRMAAAMKEAGVTSAVLGFGGQLLAFGRPAAAEVASPDNRQTASFAFTLDDASLSTSGTSEHGRHLLDPGTGQPCPAWGSVSVVAANGLTADVLSTALFVLGPDRGRAWAEAHQVAALFQLADGSAFTTSALVALEPHALAQPTSRSSQ